MEIQTFTEHAPGLFSQLNELGVDMLVGLLKHRNQVLSLLGIAGREKSIGRSCAV